MLALTEAKEIELRGYQTDAVEALRQKIRADKKRVILCAGTGAGKTVIAAHLLRQADRKGSYSLFLVDRIALVNQTSATLDSYGIRHGVVQGSGHSRHAPHENVQVCSIMTLAKRKLPRDPDLIVYDECHAQYKSTLDYMAQHPNAVKIGLTATPFTKGMGQHWDSMVNVIPTRKLIEEGHLIQPKMYVAKSPEEAELGLDNFGEYSNESASTAGIRIVGDVVAEWIGKTREHFGGPAKTIVFSPTVDHGRELCAAFREAGFNFQQVSYLDTDEARALNIDEFRRPDSIIVGLVSCGVLTKGFDVPDCLIGISCKPYRKSLSSHMQEIGRIMRPAPGKDIALWLDHAGNLERFALDMFDVWDNGAGELDKATKRDTEKRERNEETRKAVVCPECSGAIRANVCTGCGWEKPARSEITAEEGTLVEFAPLKGGMTPRAGLRADCLKDPRAVWNGALCYALEHTKKGEAAARKWAAGIWYGVYPNQKMGFGWFDMAPQPPNLEAYSLAEREVKRFRKSKRAA